MPERGDTDYSSLSNVNANMGYFTRADIEGTYRACDLQHLLGWPSDKQLTNALINNLIINRPVLSNDTRRARAICEPYTAILKGEMMRKNTKHVEFKQRIPIQA